MVEEDGPEEHVGWVENGSFPYRHCRTGALVVHPSGRVAKTGNGLSGRKGISANSSKVQMEAGEGGAGRTGDPFPFLVGRVAHEGRLEGNLVLAHQEGSPVVQVGSQGLLGGHQEDHQEESCF